MRAILTVMVVAMLAAVAANAQPAEVPPPPPPMIDEMAPPEPEPPPAVEAPVTRSPREELVDRAIRYYEQSGEAPPEVGAYLAQNPAFGTVLYVVRRAQNALIWLFLFLLIGFGGRRLLRRLLGVPAADDAQPRGTGRAERSPEGPRTDRRTAVADVIAWIVALAIACEAVGLPWFGALWSGLMELAVALAGAVVTIGLLLALGAVVAWAFSAEGRRLVLSLLGWFYLTRSANRPPADHEFILPDGRPATIVRTDALHSVMQTTEDEEPVTVPNAHLMEQYFHWAAPEKKSEPRRTEAEDA